MKISKNRDYNEVRRRNGKSVRILWDLEDTLARLEIVVHDRFEYDTWCVNNEDCRYTLDNFGE